MVRQQASNLIAYVHRGEQMNTTDCLLYNLSRLNTSCRLFVLFFRRLKSDFSLLRLWLIPWWIRVGLVVNKVVLLRVFFCFILLINVLPLLIPIFREPYHILGFWDEGFISDRHYDRQSPQKVSSTYQINLKLILFKLKRDKQNLRHLQNISPSTSTLYVKVSEMTPWKIVIREDTKSLRYKFDFLPTAREVSLRNSNIASWSGERKYSMGIQSNIGEELPALNKEINV
jgi:hypothetical protein